jgi:glutamine synthetase type III
VLVEREKVMDMKELKILEKAVKYFKDYEHGKLTEISGKEIDELVKDAGEYNKVLKEIRTEIEKKMQERTAEQIYKELFELLKKFFGNVSQDEWRSKC